MCQFFPAVIPSHQTQQWHFGFGKRGSRCWRSYFNCCVNRWYRHVRFPVQKEVWWSFLVTLLTFYLANKSSPLSVNSFKTVGKAPGNDLKKLVEGKPRICKAAIRRTVLMSLVMFKKQQQQQKSTERTITLAVQMSDCHCKKYTQLHKLQYVRKREMKRCFFIIQYSVSYCVMHKQLHPSVALLQAVKIKVEK